MSGPTHESWSIEKVELTPWPDDKLAPVIFMIDDLADAWVDVNNNGVVDPGEDWGFCRDGPASSFTFLVNNILKDFPELKVTFFLPVGRHSPVVLHGTCPMHAWAIDERPGFGEFLRGVAADPRFEIAYHGTDHGIPGPRASDFRQEWLTFNSVEEAVARTQQGVQLFEKVLGCKPRGGKYCGYSSNEFSDASIDRSGFFWWCREWQGEERPNSPSLEPHCFGQTQVIDLPSTVSGAMLTSLYRPCEQGSVWKKLVKRFLRPALIAV